MQARLHAYDNLHTHTFSSHRGRKTAFSIRAPSDIGSSLETNSPLHVLDSEPFRSESKLRDVLGTTCTRSLEACLRKSSKASFEHYDRQQHGIAGGYRRAGEFAPTISPLQPSVRLIARTPVQGYCGTIWQKRLDAQAEMSAVIVAFCQDVSLSPDGCSLSCKGASLSEQRPIQQVFLFALLGLPL